MNNIRLIDENTIEIDGVKYAKAEPIKPEWPKIILQNSAYTHSNKEMVVWPIEHVDYRRAHMILKCIAAARVINGDWVPDWEDDNPKYYPLLVVNKIFCDKTVNKSNKDFSLIYFPTEQACQHFIDYFSDIWLEAIG